MNTLKQTMSDFTDESCPPIEHRITGFDGGTRPIFKEPSLYLSLFVVFVAAFICLGKTPSIFCGAFAALSVMTVAFHALAERLLFRSNKEFESFAAPFEGVFVLTLGAILPGVSLLLYGIYSLSTGVDLNLFEEMGKLVLLLIVPLFNFAVWSSVKRGYIIRPRIVGLMNGLALGLSASWTIIWLNSLMDPKLYLSCKFGWMMLLCVSPFMLCAAACLNFDLWRKTETGISRVTTTFAVLGGLLSMMFVFTPVIRSFFVQSLITEAKQGATEAQAKAVAALRSIATPEDLRPSKNPVGGFALASLLVPGRGLDAATDRDKDVYFNITGQPFSDRPMGSKESEDEPQFGGGVVGYIVPGLSLAKSEITGNLDASSLTSSIDWSLNFHNATYSTQEARAEIRLPKGAVVSQVKLWINGEARPGVFAPTVAVRQVYDAIVSSQRDPLLVTMSAPDRILVQCFPVPANGGAMKILLGFKVPMESTDGKTCSMQMPKLVSGNFAQPKRHRVRLLSRDKPVQSLGGLVAGKNDSGYTLTGIFKTDDDSKTLKSIGVERASLKREIAVLDPVSQDNRYIVEKLQDVVTHVPDRLSVVLDCSSSLKGEVSRIKEILTNLPPRLKPMIYLVAQTNAEDAAPAEITATPLKNAIAAIGAQSFVGGQNNHLTIREALETTAEQPHGIVLWIHGPQPMTQNLSESNAIDLVNSVRLYDLQIGSGSNKVMRAIQTADVSHMLSVETLRDESITEFKTLVAGWEKPTKRLTIQRTVSKVVPAAAIVADRLVSDQVTSIWAGQEVAKLVANGRQADALKLGGQYGIVSEVTGGLVLDNVKDMAAFKSNAEKFTSKFGIEATPTGSGSVPSSWPGLVGAPVDPRYGQSNEIGQIADFGYDTARDISRIVTALSFLLALGIAISFLRSRKTSTTGDYWRAAGLIVILPIIVHLVGTFMINNYGGLGGGL